MSNSALVDDIAHSVRACIETQAIIADRWAKIAAGSQASLARLIAIDLVNEYPYFDVVRFYVECGLSVAGELPEILRFKEGE